MRNIKTSMKLPMSNPKGNEINNKTQIPLINIQSLTLPGIFVEVLSVIIELVKNYNANTIEILIFIR